MTDVEKWSEVKNTIYGFFGWTPTLLRKLKKAYETKAVSSTTVCIVLGFLVAADLIDAIFDTILAIGTIFSGSSGGGLAILLLVMTFVGRLVNGFYADYAALGEDHCIQDALFALVGGTVFLLEDGAFILLQATTDKERNFVDIFSMYMSAICGFGYVLFFAILVILLIPTAYQFVRGITGLLGGSDEGHCLATIFLMGLPIFAVVTLLGCAIFQVYILFEYVILRQDNDVLPQDLETTFYVVYAVGGAIAILCSLFLSRMYATGDTVRFTSYDEVFKNFRNSCCCGDE